MEDFVNEDVKQLVLSWIKLDPDWEQTESLYFGFLPTYVEETAVERPVYLFFSSKILFMDFPICKHDELDIATVFNGEQSIPWGMGRVNSAYTFHNVLTYDLVLSHPESARYLLEVIASQAGHKEFAITGEIFFTVDKQAERPRQTDNQTSSFGHLKTSYLDSSNDSLGEPLEVTQAKKSYRNWAKKYLGNHRSLDVTEKDQTELAALDPHHIWTGMSNSEGNGFANGYFPSSDTYSYIVSDKPWSGEGGAIWIPTNIYVTCSSCEGEGLIEDDETCDDCEGQGSNFTAVD
jgi:hypothetical protein